MRSLATLAPLALAAGAFAAVPDYASVEVIARGSVPSTFNLPAGVAPTNAAIDSFGLVAIGYVSSDGIGGPGLAIDGASVYQAPDGAFMTSVSTRATGGFVVFGQELADGTGSYQIHDIVAGTTNPVQTAGGADDLQELSFLNSPPSMALDGEFSFLGFTSDDVGHFFRWTPGGLVEYVSTDDPGIVSLTRFTALNNADQLAGFVNFDGGGRALRRYDAPGSFVTIAEDTAALPGSDFVSFAPNPAISNDGTVAFIGNLSAGGRGVFANDGVDMRTIATTANPLVSFITNSATARPSIQLIGTLVAFHGRDASGNDAVFVGDGVDLTAAISEGDVVSTDLGDATVTALSPAVSINLDGVLTVVADLELVSDGSDAGSAVIVLAPAQPIGDLNDDGVVAFGDLVILLSLWGTSDPLGDLNADGTVDFNDIVVLLSFWTT